MGNRKRGRWYGEEKLGTGICGERGVGRENGKMDEGKEEGNCNELSVLYHFCKNFVKFCCFYINTYESDNNLL